MLCLSLHANLLPSSHKRNTRAVIASEKGKKYHQAYGTASIWVSQKFPSWQRENWVPQEEYLGSDGSLPFPIEELEGIKWNWWKSHSEQMKSSSPHNRQWATLLENTVDKKSYIGWMGKRMKAWTRPLFRLTE